MNEILPTLFTFFIQFGQNYVQKISMTICCVTIVVLCGALNTGVLKSP